MAWRKGILNIQLEKRLEDNRDTQREYYEIPGPI